MADPILSSLNTSSHFIPATLGGSYYKYFDFADEKRLLSHFFLFLLNFLLFTSCIYSVCPAAALEPVVNCSRERCECFSVSLDLWGLEPAGSGCQSFYSPSLMTMKSNVSSLTWWRVPSPLCQSNLPSSSFRPASLVLCSGV